MSSIADLKLEIEKNPDYDFLIDGVDSSGGSAPGNNNSGGAGKTMKRTDFDAMDPKSKMDFMTKGGKTTD